MTAEAPPPSPERVASLDSLAVALTDLRAWAGNPSYAELARRIARARAARGIPVAEHPGRITVYDCFKPGRRRVDVELIVDITKALGLDDARAAQWRQACRVALGDATAESVVDAFDELPADLDQFTGRRAQLHTIADKPTGAYLINGMAGAGKTRFAVHAAHQLSDRFPGPRLYVDLRGFDPHQPPADPAAVLAALLRLLGADTTMIERLDLAGRGEHYRNLLASAPALVILDNAASEEQLGPLLPGGDASLVLVTSRRRLDRLGEEVRRVPLGVLTAREALELLANSIGDDRIDAEPAAAAQLVELCGRLPLDLAITAGTIQCAAGWSLADQVRRLESLPRDEAVRPSLAASYEALPTELRRPFRLLALHPGRDITAHTAAALCDTSLDGAHQILLALAAENLLLRRSAGRYEYHNLVHSYADRLCHQEERHADHQAALTRLLDHYCHASALAMNLIAPHDAERRPAVAPGGTAVPRFVDTDSATAWLHTERPNIIAAAVRAADTGLVGYTAALSGLLADYLDRTSYWQDARTLHTRALAGADGTDRGRALGALAWVDYRTGRFSDALGSYRNALALAEEAGDQADAARLLNRVGAVYQRLGQHERALQHHVHALAAVQEIGDRAALAATHGNLGVVYNSLDRHEESLEHYQRAAEMFAEIRDHGNAGRVYGNLGMLLTDIGRLDEALASHNQALASIRAVGDPDSEACVLSALGVVQSRLGRHQEAVDNIQAAIVIFTDLGAQPGIAHGHADLAGAYLRMGRHREALEAARWGLEHAQAIEDRSLLVAVHIHIGDAHRLLGSPAEAEHGYQAALGLAVAEREEQARAYDGLGHLAAARGDRAAAVHWHAALALYRELGLGEALTIEAQLASLG